MLDTKKKEDSDLFYFTETMIRNNGIAVKILISKFNKLFLYTPDSIKIILKLKFCFTYKIKN